ncbi:hypothetical protein D2T81_20685 [Azospirillum brasilense]|nr:hypothetical protein [Azospirillum brasilense]RIW00572.1 hypothetical protein D2T81_20685 [Azospirillum brasilense]
MIFLFGAGRRCPLPNPPPPSAREGTISLSRRAGEGRGGGPSQPLRRSSGKKSAQPPTSWPPCTACPPFRPMGSLVRYSLGLRPS